MSWKLHAHDFRNFGESCLVKMLAKLVAVYRYHYHELVRAPGLLVYLETKVRHLLLLTYRKAKLKLQRFALEMKY